MAKQKRFFGLSPVKQKPKKKKKPDAVHKVKGADGAPGSGDRKDYSYAYRDPGSNFVLPE